MHKELSSLLVAIEKDVQEYRKREKAGIFCPLKYKPQKTISGTYCSWWQNFIKVLISLPYPENYHHQLVDEMKRCRFVDKVLDEFQTSFPSEKRAIWWYSRSGCFYDILNQAFRQQNVKVLLLFGSFLQDLHRQLKSKHFEQKQLLWNPVITVYRGQVLSNKDFEELVVGCLVRCYSFFSSSANRDIALSFLDSSSSNEGTKNVLFEIEVDYQKVCLPFANVSQLSFYPEEQETLFMPNTYFLITDHRFEEANTTNGYQIPYWLVKLKILSDHDLFSNREFEVTNAPRKTVKNCVDALSEMLENDFSKDIPMIFNTLATLYPKEAEWIEASRLYCLAMLEFEINYDDYTLVVSYHEQALAIWQKYYLQDEELNCYFNIAENYFALGELFGHSVENQKNASICHWKQALQLYEQAFVRCPKIATDYQTVSILYKLVLVCQNLLPSNNVEQYGSKAIIYQRKRIDLMSPQKPVLSASNEIATHYRILADIYATIHQYGDALKSYKEAFRLYLRNDNDEAEYRTSCNELISLCKDIVKICIKHTHDFDLALQYQLLQHEYELKTLRTNTPAYSTLLSYVVPKNLAESHFSVSDCYINVNQYVEAHEHLIQGLEYMRNSRELLLQDGRTVSRSDGYCVFLPLTEDDEQLKGYDLRINEKEEKLRIIKQLLEKR